MKKPKKQELGNARQLRMSKDLEDRVRKYQERFRKETGVELDFSTAVRTLIEKGLTCS